MSLLLGLDGGGSKTELRLTEHGRLLARQQAGASSLTRRPAAEVERELSAALAALFLRARRRPEQCGAACGGFAGAGRAPARRRLLGILGASLPHARLLVLPDFQIAFAAALGQRDGVLVIAGTGAVAFGRHGTRELRLGGRLPPGGDPGSGEWIVRQAGRRRLLSPTSVPAAQLPEVLARAAGNPAARRVLERAGAELAELASATARRLRLEQPQVAVLGGVIRHSPQVRAALRARLAVLLPGARVRFPRAAPVTGALQLARTLLESPPSRPRPQRSR